jgi:hypothetical protein
MDNIKTKLLNDYGNIKVYEVNGHEVRRTMDPNFTNYGWHYDFDFIPENELWIDHEAAPGEVKFYITQMLVKKKFLDLDYSPEEAEKFARRAELAERHKSAKYKEAVNKSLQQGNSKEKEIKKSGYSEINGVAIYIVDGELVRDFFYEDFAEGGHDLVYPWIPDNEVWIDDDVSDDEQPPVAFHEMYERGLMLEGQPYDDAHNAALELEYMMNSID